MYYYINKYIYIQRSIHKSYKNEENKTNSFFTSCFVLGFIFLVHKNNSFFYVSRDRNYCLSVCIPQCCEYIILNVLIPVWIVTAAGWPSTSTYPTTTLPPHPLQLLLVQIHTLFTIILHKSVCIQNSRGDDEIYCKLGKPLFCVV